MGRAEQGTHHIVKSWKRRRKKQEGVDWVCKDDGEEKEKKKKGEENDSRWDGRAGGKGFVGNGAWRV